MANPNLAEPQTLGSAVNKTEIFFENNGKRVIYALLAVIVVVALFFCYRSLVVAPRVDKAADMISQAQYRFEAVEPDYELALNGDANGAGFLEVADTYGSTPAGNIAKHYAGICYLKLGDLDNAAKYLADYSSVKGIPGALINAQNLGLQGEIAVEKGDYAKAVKLYEKASSAADNDLTTPMYLYKAGLAEQAAGNNDKATALYQRVIDQHPASYYARESDKRLGTIQ